MATEVLDAYVAHRPTAALLPGGIAPMVTSSMFKIKPSAKLLPAKRWDNKFSRESARRTGSNFKASARCRDSLDTISIGTARPSSRYYPWQSLHINARNVNSHESNDFLSESFKTTSCVKHEIGYDLGLGLNYGFAAGSPQLLRFVTEHVDIVHRPPYEDWASSLTCGTTSALDIVFRMFCNSGDSVLSEAFTYPGTIEAVKALDIHLIGIPMDEYGLIPRDLDSVLSNWDLSKGPKPTLLYTIPSGQNPTGVTQPVDRRQAIYEIAEQHDLIIVEDDPYYFIQLQAPSSTVQPIFKSSACLADLSVGERNGRYLDQLQPSYLSLDRSGRILRLDATSKILAPGLRCGWITGCSQLIDKFISHTEMSTIAPSGPSQILLYKLLDEAWGHSGFISWLDHLSSQFRGQLLTLLEACEWHLPTGLCTWSVPSAGMFLWVKVDWQRHPAAKTADFLGREEAVIVDIEDRIYTSARLQGVLISKGSWFAVDRASIRELFFRLTFVAANANSDLEKAAMRLGKVLREEFEIDEQ